MQVDHEMVVLGADVGKEELVLEIISAKDESIRHRKAVCNSALGHVQVLTWLKQWGFSRVIVCMEATGYYSEGFAEFMYANGHQVFVINPKRIRRYAEALGLLGKSDKADAHAIAEFGVKQHSRLRPWHPRSAARRELAKLRAHIIGLGKALQAFNLRKDALDEPFVTQASQRVIELLQKEIERAEERASHLISSDAELASEKKILTSLIGVGEVISNSLLTHVDFGAFKNGRQVKRFVGVVPKREQSGKCLNTRGHLSREGNGHLRGLLWNAARAAVQHDPRMREYAKRLYARGKGPDAVRTAVAAKILLTAHALIRNKTLYDPDYRSPLAA